MLTNDPAIIERLRPLFAELVGKEAVHERRPMMGAEDFSRYGMTDERIPLCMFWVGATAASVVREAEKSGQVIPSLHSPFFYADAPVALPVGTSAMSAAVIELMRK